MVTYDLTEKELFNLLKNNIYEDYLRDYIREWFEDDIWQNPEIYFNRDDFELTAEQERRMTCQTRLELDVLLLQMQDGL